MTISFSCESCNKKIKAPDNSGGKYGPCPYCKHRCYIPMPQSDEIKLNLAPIDEKEEIQYDELMVETRNITENILQTKDDAPDPSEQATSETNEKELTKSIILYLRQMVDGQLDEAQQRANKISPYRKKAIAILDRLATDENPEPELAEVAPQLLKGLIRKLRTRLS